MMHHQHQSHHRRQRLQQVEEGGEDFSSSPELIIKHNNNNSRSKKKRTLLSRRFEFSSKNISNVLLFVALSSLFIWRLYSTWIITTPTISTTVVSPSSSSSSSNSVVISPRQPQPSIRGGITRGGIARGGGSRNTTSISNAEKHSSNNNKEITIDIPAPSVTTYSPINASECGVWFAPSTIPGAGLGMFAGRNFDEGQYFLPSGDIVIPLVDLYWFHGRKGYNFLWHEYYWSASSQGMEGEGIRKTDGISPGFGAAINSYYDLFNVEEGMPVKDEAGLIKHKDPGYGAFTRYHNRAAWAHDDINVGQELFCSYGDSWFQNRKGMEFVPLTNDMREAEKLMKKLKKKYRKIPALVNVTRRMLETAMKGEELKEKITNRVLGALPKTSAEWRTALRVGLKNLRVQQTTRSVPNLDQTGACIDNIRAGNSTLPQAGRGAFATRRLPKNTVVAPVPLLHIVNRSLMDTYNAQDMEIGGPNKQVAGQQLLINYCFGHPQTTLLLSPYGYATSLVNHNQTRANVKLRWGDPQRSNHHPEWLNFTIEQLDQHYVAGLAWEMVSLREILPGEEILMDYGSDWETAWLEYNQKWKQKQKQQAKLPQNTTNTFKKITAEQLNRMPDALKTWNKTRYISNGILLMGYYKFYRPQVWQSHYRQYGNYSDLIKNSETYSCEITSVYQDQWGNEWYNATYYDDERLVMVPREAFVFQDMSNASSHWDNEHAFRHDIAIPDELLPASWRNR